MSPSHEAHWDIVRKRHSAGTPPGVELEARDAIESWHDGVGDGDCGPFDHAPLELQNEPWLEPSSLRELAEHPDPNFARTYRAFMDHGPLPILRAVEAPMLAIVTPNDESMDAAETARILDGLMREGRDIQIKLYPGFGYSMRSLGAVGVAPRLPELPDDFHAVQAKLIRAVAAQSN